MLEIIEPKEIDIKGGAAQLSKTAINMNVGQIEKLLDEISKAKDKTKHNVYKKLKEKKIAFNGKDAGKDKEL